MGETWTVAPGAASGAAAAVVRIKKPDGKAPGMYGCGWCYRQEMDHRTKKIALKLNFSHVVVP